MTTAITPNCGSSPGADSQELLQTAMRQLRVIRFQVMDPSLEQIFIERISGKHD